MCFVNCLPARIGFHLWQQRALSLLPFSFSARQFQSLGGRETKLDEDSQA